MQKTMLLASAAILIISCAAEERAEEYHPLSVGLQWEYAVTQTDTVTITGTQISTITAAVSSSHGTLYEQVTTTEWDDTSMTVWLDTSYLQKTEGNVLFYSDLNDAEPDTLLVIPIVAGNVWTVRTEPWGDMTGEAIGLEDITLPTGTFSDCWNIEYTGLDAIGNSWFARDVGLIKHHSISSTNEFLKELINFHRL